jgi:hypothetical protein
MPDESLELPQHLLSGLQQLAQALDQLGCRYALIGGLPPQKA